MRKSSLWLHVLTLMESNPRRLGNVLPIMCKRHGKTTCIGYSDDWEKTDGGCMNPCGATLRCSHPCPLQCHPYPHESVQCAEECPKTLPCGHGCTKKCGETCLCPCEEFSKIKQAELMNGTNVAADSRQSGQGTLEPQFNGQHHPAHGSTPYLPPQDPTTGKAKWQVRPVSGWGPSDEVTNSTEQRSMRTGYRTSISPEKQGQSRKEWRDYAKGGFVVDDERLQKIDAPITRPLPSSMYGAQGNSKASPVKGEAVKVMPNGRLRVMQVYQPGLTRKEGSQDGRQISLPTQHLRGGGTPSPLIPQPKPSPRKPVEDRRVRLPAEMKAGRPPVAKINNKASVMDELKDLDSFFRAS